VQWYSRTQNNFKLQLTFCCHFNRSTVAPQVTIPVNTTTPDHQTLSANFFQTFKKRQNIVCCGLRN
jgi:hypothetical protein